MKLPPLNDSTIGTLTGRHRSHQLVEVFITIYVGAEHCTNYLYPSKIRIRIRIYTSLARLVKGREDVQHLAAVE